MNVYHPCYPTFFVLAPSSIFNIRQKIIHGTSLSYVHTRTYLHILHLFTENLPYLPSPSLPSSLLSSPPVLSHPLSVRPFPSCVLPAPWMRTIWYRICNRTSRTSSLVLELIPFCNICKIILKTKTTVSKKSSTSYIEDVIHRDTSESTGP